MNKINKIRVSDFRIYHGEEEFDFTKNDSPANLVAIYAPNGYGKTSFFDAVEWSYSGKIMRLESNEILKKSLKDSDFSLQDKIVLTNRKSYQKNKKKLGKIEIETQEKKLVRKVTKRKRVGVNIIDDYRPGELNNSFKKEEIESLTSTNLLSQDQIDSFLRYKTPEEKFNELKVFWPQGEEAVTKCNVLSGAESALIEQLTDIKKNIEIAAKKIIEIGNSEEAIANVNQSIKALTEDKNSSFSTDLLTKTFTKNEYEVLLKACILATTEVKSSIESRVKDEAELAELLTENTHYTKNVDLLKKLEKELRLINQKKKLYVDLKSLESQKLELEKVLSKVEIKRNDFKTVQIEKVKFSEDKANIENYSNEIQTLKLQRNTNRHRDSINKGWVNRLKLSKEQLISKLSCKKEYHKEYSIQSKKLIDFQKQVKPTNDELKKLAIRQNLNGLDVNTAQETIRTLTSIVEHNDWTNNTLNQYVDLQPEISKLKSTIKSIEALKELLKTQETEFKDSNSLNDSLDKIKGWGESYVEKTGVKICPLCTTEFEEFNDLIEKIKSQKNKVLKIEKLQKSIEEINVNLEQKNNKRSELEKKLSSLVSKIISFNSKELTNYFKLRDELQNKQFTLEKRAADLENEIAIIQKFLSKYIESGHELDKENVSKLDSIFLSDIRLFEASLSRLTRIVEKREEKSNSFNKKYLSLQDQIRTNEHKVELIKATLSYQLMSGLVEKYHLKDLTDKTLKKIFQTHEEESDSKEFELKVTKAEIKKVNEQLVNSDCEYKSSEIEGMLVDFNVKAKELIEATKNYQTLYKKHITNEKVSAASIESQINVISKDKHSFVSTLSLLESFQADLEIIENAIEKNMLEKDVAALEYKIPTLKNAISKINNAKESCIKYIQEGINNYFNKDVINQIYKRIEPHPSLTEINFKAEVGNHGPRLLITAKGLTDEVNPNLFLSAGQVNILSLSIFLAKAFEYGSDTISTIFMDDPVQNLSDINILSFIDLLRTLTTEHNKQIVLSTHEEKFFRLLQNKLPPEYCSSKYLEFESEGKLLKESEELIVEA
jgi:DNA repair exonuclease SbcCD ATPase subunit